MGLASFLLNKFHWDLGILLAVLLLSTLAMNATSGQTASSTTGSAPATEWQKAYGNNSVESISNMVQTSDGGYAFLDLGWAYQFTFTPSTFYKIDSSGNVQWQKTFNLFSAASFVQTSDGGYTILGAWSTYGTTYENTPTLIKTDSEGDIKSVENYSTGIGGQILLTSDGGFAVLSGGANLLYYPGTSSATITKTDSHGIKQWNKTFREPANFSDINSMIQTTDGGYALIGTTSYNGTSDTINLYFWMVKTDSQGNLVWSREYGDGLTTVNPNLPFGYAKDLGLNRDVSGDNEAFSVVQTSDGGYAFVGRSFPQDHAVTMLVKTDSNGNIEWNQTFDGGYSSSLIQTSEGGLAFAGSGGIYKIDSNGNIQWTKGDVTFPSLSIIPSLLGVSSLIETSDGALAGLGVGNPDGNPRMGTIYLFKTEAFLPLPTPSPTPIPAQMLNTSVSALTIGTVVVVVLIIAVFLLFYLKKNRKSENKLTV
jgi:hypothetical protein